MNDPNGLIYDGEYFHLYYQYDPIAPYAGFVHWGSAKSKDLYSWEDGPIALKPTTAGEAFSGCAIIDRNNTSGFFPALPDTDPRSKEPNLALIYTRASAKLQTQDIAISRDGGQTYTEISENPILDIHSNSFRDPKVFFHAPSGRWIMTVVQSRLHKVSFYGSFNLKDWMHLSDFESAGLFGIDYECPNLIEVPLEGTNETRWLMLISINPGAPQGGSTTQYFVGFFDGERFKAEDEHTVFGLIDFCKDSYALQCYENLPLSQATMIAWLGNWQYGEEVPHTTWRGVMTLPRRLSVRRDTDGWIRLVQRPLGLENLRLAQIPTPFRHLPARTTETVALPKNQAIELIIKASLEPRDKMLPDGSLGRAGRFSIDFANNNGEKLTVGFDGFFCQLWVERGGLKGFANPFFTREFSTSLTPDLREFSLRIVYDACTLEIYVNDGISVGSSLVFPQEALDRVSFSTTNTAASIQQLEIYPLRSTMPRPFPKNA
ncbi:levanase [Neokomagataea thailandica NBRC 106555]|nr:levanase [Neokomagataea thailandica NBRC 106555]